MSGTIPESTAPASLPPDCVPKLFTVADLAVLPSELPSGTVRYELHHGRLITMPPPGNTHGAVEGNLITALKVLARIAHRAT
jgi:Uma2 family endonuclease